MFRSPVISSLESGPAKRAFANSETVHAHVAAVEQPGQFGNGGPLQAQAHVELVFGIRGGMQQAARAELSEVLGSAIGAGRRAGKTNHDVAALVGIDIDVGGADVEDGLGVAEFEVQAAVADLDVRQIVRTAGA